MCVTESFLILFMTSMLFIPCRLLALEIVLQGKMNCKILGQWSCFSVGMYMSGEGNGNGEGNGVAVVFFKGLYHRDTYWNIFG